MKNLTKISLLIMLLTLFNACSSKAKISPEFSGETGRLIALLPSDAPSDIQREKVSAIRFAVIDRLRSMGFFVLEDSIINRICSSPECTEKDQLEEKYFVESFAKLKLKSVYRTNFGAGTYSTIAGQFQILSPSGDEVYLKEYRQSKRGGLLFNSGQAIQALTSQFTENKNEEFEQLSSKFTKGLLKEIPNATQRGQIDDAIAVGIDKIEVEKQNAPVYKVCALGSPTSEATLIVNKIRTNLREVTSGRYCGIYRIEERDRENLSIELRSPFGNSERKDLGIPVSNI